MKRFCLKVALFVAVQCGIAALLHHAYLKKFPVSERYLYASVLKHELLNRQESPRLVFIGGSSVAFGIDSGQVAGSCGFHPVNLGLHGDLGLAFNLNEVETGLRSGDVVVLSPEYEQFHDTFWGTSQMLMHAIECRSANAAFLEPQHYKMLADRGMLDRWGGMVRAVFRRETATLNDSIYRPQSFNENGDMVGHHGRTAKPGPARDIPFSREKAMQTVSYINRFVSRCEKKGVRVLFAHPPLAQFAFEANKRSLDELEAILQQNLQCPILDSMAETLFPAESLYDTVYHLGREGAKIHSTRVSERLREKLRPPELRQATRTEAAQRN